MKFMVIVKATHDSEAGVMPSQQLLTDMGNYNEALAKAGVLLAGEGLHPSAKGVRVRFSGSGRTVIDGPFAETKELIAGYWLWRVNSLQEAIERLKRCPNPHPEDCEVEIRQVFDADDFGEEFTPELRKQEARVRAQALGLGTVRFEQGRGKLTELQKATIMRDYVEWIQSLVRPGQFRGEAKLAPASLARYRHLTASACFGTDSKCQFKVS